MQAVIFVGIQASGKSTFYSQRFFLTHLRINLDMLKTRHREKRLLETCLEISQSFVNELLYQQAGTNFNDLPNWQKRGVGLYWESYQKEAINPVTNEKVFATRRQIKIDLDLPMKEDYSEFIRGLVIQEHPDRL